MTKDLVISRPLGDEENFFRCRTDVDWYRNFGSVAAYSQNLNNPTLLARALRKTLLDYHVLACNVFKESGADRTVVRPIKEAKFGDLVEFFDLLFSPHGKSVPEDVLTQICRTKYFYLYVEKPLFKIFVYGSHDLGASFEHTLSDGIVAVLFHEIFLQNLAYCDNPDNWDDFVSNYGPLPDQIDMDTVIFDLKKDLKYIKHSLPPSVEMFMEDPSIDYTDGDANHYSKQIPESHPVKWPGRFPAVSDFSVAIKQINIDPEYLKLMINKCREHKVLLTSYIACIQALVLQPIYGSQNHTLCVVAMTMRRFISAEKIEPNYRDVLEKGYKLLGNFAHMGVPQFFAPVAEFSWERVQAFQTNMSLSSVNSKLLNMRKPIYDLFLKLDDNKHEFHKTLGVDKADSIKMSNIGAGKFPVFEGGQLGSWTVKDIVFAQDMAPGASEFVLNMVSSPLGGLNIVLSYCDHRFDDTEYENFDEFPIKLKEQLLKNVGL